MAPAVPDTLMGYRTAHETGVDSLVDGAIHVPPMQSRQLVNRGEERVEVVAAGAG
ncbi:MAG: hypothetical protein V5A62_17690 [Haloarculaceae archaeon]